MPGGGTVTASAGVTVVARETLSIFVESPGPEISLLQALVERETGIPPDDSGAESAIIRMNVPVRLGASDEAASIDVATDEVRVVSTG